MTETQQQLQDKLVEVRCDLERARALASRDTACRDTKEGLNSWDTTTVTNKLEIAADKISEAIVALGSLQSRSERRNVVSMTDDEATTSTPAAKAS